jgi:hypothetical protein
MNVFKERAERKYQVVEEPAKLGGLLKQYATGKVYYIKGFYDRDRS